MLFVTSLKTQYENLGDLLIGTELVRRLSSQGAVLCLANSVPAWYLNEFKSSLPEAASPILFLDSPMGLFREMASALRNRHQITVVLSPGHFSTKKISLQRLILAGLTRLSASIRVAQFGASYSEIDAASVLLFKQVPQNAIFVRDEFSQSELLKKGIKAGFAPDLALGMTCNSSPQEQRYFCISLREFPTENINQLEARVGPLARQATSAGLEPIIFWQVSRDKKVSEVLASRIGIPLYNNSRERPSLAQARALYSQTAVICSNRLHALLLASACGAIPLAMLPQGEKKVAGVFKTAGLAEYISKSAEDDALVASRLMGKCPEQGLLPAFTKCKGELDKTFARMAAHSNA